MLSAILFDVPNNAPRQGIGIDWVKFARGGMRYSREALKAGVDARKVVFANAWNVRMKVGMEGKRIKMDG